MEKTQTITTKKMSLRSRLEIAWWCITGQPFKTEPIGKIHIIEVETFNFVLKKE